MSNDLGRNNGGGETVFSTSRTTATQSGGSLLLAGGASASPSASGKISANSSGAQSYGFNTLTTDISPVGTTRAAVNYLPNTGAADPGGDPIPGTEIPVPDGWGFLLLMVAGYAVNRNLKIKKIEGKKNLS